MKCNWELFELRVAIFLRGQKHKPTGNFTGQILLEFFNVMPDLGTIGIGDFQGSGDDCNFKSVFSQMVELNAMPFSFLKEKIRPDRLNFGNLQAAERNGITYRAAKLYVHRRDQSDLSSLTTGIGMLLENVTIIFTAKGPMFYVHLSGESANMVNA